MKLPSIMDQEIDPHVLTSACLGLTRSANSNPPDLPRTPARRSRFQSTSAAFA